LGEVLSQNEIDNLLAALSAGELDVDKMQDEEEKPVKNYDFNRPAKFSKEHLRTLEIIYEHYGRLISTNLPVYLRKNVQISVSSSETVTFSEFSNALSNPVILGILNFQPLNGNIIIELSTNLGYAMIDRMLGGSGVPLEKSRGFSEIETTIIEKMMVLFTQLMRDPWKNVIEIAPMLILATSPIASFSTSVNRVSSTTSDWPPGLPAALEPESAGALPLFPPSSDKSMPFNRALISSCDSIPSPSMSSSILLPLTAAFFSCQNLPHR